MLEKDYDNQEALKILKQLSEGQINYCQAYEMIESKLL